MRSNNWILTICRFRATGSLRPMREHRSQYCSQFCEQSGGNVLQAMRPRTVPYNRHCNILDRLASDRIGRIRDWCLCRVFCPRSTTAASPSWWCPDRPMCRCAAIANSILRFASGTPACDAAWCSFVASPAPHSASSIWWQNPYDFCQHCKRVNCGTNGRRIATDRCSALLLVPIEWWTRFARNAAARDSLAHCFP